MILYIVLGLFSCVIFKMGQMKLRYNMLDEAFRKLEDLNKSLDSDNREYIKQAEHYKTKSESLEEKIRDIDSIHKISMDNAKGTLADLGNKLSQQLIDMSKKENQESRIISEERINKTTEKFYLQTEKIMNLVSNISKDVDSSKSSVDMIKKSLLTPLEVGEFAEITLENILKNSGLIENTDYVLQKSILHQDGALRPDGMIFLPGDNMMVIDAKSSKFIANADNCPEKDRKLTESMHKHINMLSSKDYTGNISSHLKSKNKKNSGNIMTFMFLPTEHVLERIYKTDPSFITKAWKKQIFPIGPAGLVNIISLANLQINDAKRIDNYSAIIDEVVKLVNSVSSLANHSTNIGNALGSLLSHYDKFARSFNSNFLSKIKNLEKLGLENQKNTCIPLKRYNIISDDWEMISADLEKSPVEVE